MWLYWAYALGSPLTDAPHIPSDEEAKNYLYSLYSDACLIARSNSDIWMQPTGPEAYLKRKEFRPFDPHLLNDLWEDSIGPTIDAYLLKKEVQCTILNPLRIGMADQFFSLPAIIIGVNHDTLSPNFGLEIALKCRSILLSYQIEDVHIIVYESRFHHHAGMYEPAVSTDPAAKVCEPFSITLGIPICNAKQSILRAPGNFSSWISPILAFFTSLRQDTFCFILTEKKTPYTNIARAAEMLKKKSCSWAKLFLKTVVTLSSLPLRIETLSLNSYKDVERLLVV